MAVENPCYDVHPAQRRTRLRPSACSRTPACMKVEQFRADLRAWLDEHDLTPGPDHSLEAHMSQLARVHAALYDAGWMRYGWPEKGGGAGEGGRAWRSGHAARDRGRRGGRPPPRRTRPVFDGRSARADHDRLRA